MRTTNGRGQSPREDGPSRSPTPRMAFRRATVASVKARVAITGPAGSGKTYGALLIASGLVGRDVRVGVIDTERCRSENHADDMENDLGLVYDVLPLERHEPDDYMAALDVGFDHVGPDGVLIVDSLSHEWAAVLEWVDRNAAGSWSGNKFVAWNGPSQAHKALIAKIVNAPCHVILTMRAEMEYAVDTVAKEVKKLGLGPTQRKGVEYEWDVGLDVGQDHGVTLSKCNAASLARVLAPVLHNARKITPKVGETIRAWIAGQTARHESQAGAGSRPPRADQGGGRQSAGDTAGRGAASATSATGPSAPAPRTPTHNNSPQGVTGPSAPPTPLHGASPAPGAAAPSPPVSIEPPPSVIGAAKRLGAIALDVIRGRPESFLSEDAARALVGEAVAKVGDTHPLILAWRRKREKDPATVEQARSFVALVGGEVARAVEAKVASSAPVVHAPVGDEGDGPEDDGFMRDPDEGDR